MTRARRAAAGDRSQAGGLLEVTIEQVGARGDGIAHHGGQRIFVPLTLPGDRLQVRLGARRGDGFEGEPVAWRQQMARAVPPCPHFGPCGGCQLQHLPASDYAAWQRQQVIDALARRGLDEVTVERPWSGPLASRRRARFAFQRRRGVVRLGFRTRRRHQLVDLASCAVLEPAIVALLEPLRRLLAGLASGAGEVQATLSATGLDLLIVAPEGPGLVEREALAAFAAEQDLARLSWSDGHGSPPEPIVERRPVVVRFAGVAVEPPPDAFLQSSLAAEQAILAAVRLAIGPAARLADLFAGCGTISLALAAEGRTVRAVEADPAMAAALDQAARAAGLAARVTATVRDLERAPLGRAELDRLDAVVMDPPRAGARRQAGALAAAAVARIAMVSCHPPSFARDARLLVDGGHRLLWVRPIDAFTFADRIELVAAFAC